MDYLRPEQAEPDPSEVSTDLRSSLAIEEIGSQDQIYRHPTGSRRIVSYPTPSEDLLLIRDRLRQNGLIVGKLLTDAPEGVEGYKVPPSARTLAYESDYKRPDIFTYSDQVLYEDLGFLLGSLTKLTNSNLIIEGDISRAVAFIDFTKPDEKRLLLVPGVECLLEPKDLGVEVYDYYLGALVARFGGSFFHGSDFFRKGFIRALGTAREQSE